MAKEKDYMEGKSFNLRKMVKLVKDNKKLMKIYMSIYTKYQKDLGYHYNEIIMGLIYLLHVIKDKSLVSKYNNLRVRDTDSTRIINEEEIDETTTASSSGSYASPFAFGKEKGRFEDVTTFPNGIKVKMNTERHPMGVDTFKEMKDNNKKNKDSVNSIHKENDKLKALDKKLSSLKLEKNKIKDIIDYDKDSFSEEDLVKRNLTDDEKEQIRLNRGMGMEDVDVENEEWEERTKKQMKSPNTDLDKHKDRVDKKIVRDKASADNYPNIANPYDKVNESIEKVKNIFSMYKNVKKENK